MMHILCTICSDIVNQAESIYVTKCGHLFHHHCLSQWIERSRTCPQCRCPVTERGMFRVFPTAAGGGGADEDAGALRARLDDAQLQLRQLAAARQHGEARLQEAVAATDAALKQARASEQRLLGKEAAVAALRDQLAYVKLQNKDTQRLKEENEALKKNIQTLNALQSVLQATAAEVEQMLEGYTDVRTIATFATALKRALCEAEDGKREAREARQLLRTQLALERDTADKLRAQLALERETGHALRLQLSQQDARLADRAAKRRRAGPSPPAPDEASPPAPAEPSPPAPASPRADPARPASPYLSLRAAAAGLPAWTLKPSEMALVSGAAGAGTGAGGYSIFPGGRARGGGGGGVGGGAAYDGLGGHARPDPAPAPAPARAPLPRPGARHRLRRPPAPAPTPAGSHIGLMFQKLLEK